MIKDITNSIKAALYQRVSSPLYGTYIFSWFLFNWNIVLPLFFGVDKFDIRLESFKTSLYTSESVFIYSTIWFPFLMTVTILGLQPLLQRFLFIYTEWNKSEGLKRRDNFSSEIMLTLEQSNELRASFQNLQKFHQEILRNKESEIEEYKQQLVIKEEINNRLNKKNMELTEAVTALEISSSATSKALVNTETSFSELNSKYSRLAGLFYKQRKRQSKITGSKI